MKSYEIDDVAFREVRRKVRDHRRGLSIGRLITWSYDYYAELSARRGEQLLQLLTMKNDFLSRRSVFRGGWGSRCSSCQLVRNVLAPINSPACYARSHEMVKRRRDLTVREMRK